MTEHRRAVPLQRTDPAFAPYRHDCWQASKVDRQNHRHTLGGAIRLADDTDWLLKLAVYCQGRLTTNQAWQDLRRVDAFTSCADRYSCEYTAIAGYLRAGDITGRT